MYYNTTESTQPELKQYREQTDSQEDRILNYLKHYQCRVSPSQACLSIFLDRIPITSVRRALTNLTDSGHLVKTDTQVKGPYGRPEFQWRLADKYKQQELF